MPFVPDGRRATSTRRCRRRSMPRARNSASATWALPRWSITCTWNWCAVWLTMMRSCSARAIPARWSRIYVILLLLAELLLAVVALPAAPQDLASLVKVYRERPSVARRAQIERLASLHPKDQDGALAQLALGV